VKLLLVVNARAREGRGLSLLAGARELEPEHDCTVVRTDVPGDVDAALAGGAYEAVVVFGGDGTLNAALPALLARGLPVAVFPGGTVNDLARELGLTADWLALKRLLAGAPAPMDLLAVNGVPFSVYGSLGFGAETSKYMRRTRRRYAALRRTFPLAMAPLFVARTILFTDGYSRRLRVTRDGGPRSLRTPALYVANQSRLNNQVWLGWDRALRAGRFLTLTVHDLGRTALLRLVRQLNSSKTVQAVRDRLDVEEAQQLVIEAEDGRPISFFGDGEPLAEAPRLEVTVLPGALRVYRAPAGTSG
jgi:diacylglycerol kinase family enzyme